MRRILVTVLLLGAGVAFVVLASGSGSSSLPKYKIELDNAFGLTNGADLKVAGVRAGKISGFDLGRNNKALVSVEINQPGFGAFHADDVHCKSRPQSLIGEYFIDCDPGTHGPTLKSGATIPVDHTETTVAPDLVNNVLRMPYRERLRLLINELGAGVAGNGQALNDALHRANPALRETDRLLAVLGDQSGTIKSLTGNADKVVTALAQNGRNVARFVVEANKTSQASAARRGDLQATFHKLPAFLEELKPTMAELGRTADAQRPALANLAATSGELRRFFVDLVPFSHASTPAFRSLGQASVTGREAVLAAAPTVRILNSFARRTPEVGKNLRFILRDLDNPKRAVEKDRRASDQTNGRQQGYTGLQALLQYVFNQSLAINSFDSNGQHLLRVNAFTDKFCSPYTDTAARKKDLHDDPSSIRCQSYLGPNQPGVTTPDPSHKVSAAASRSRAAKASASGPKAHGARAAGTAPNPPATAPTGDGGLGGALDNLLGNGTGHTGKLPALPKLPKAAGRVPGAGQAGSGLLNYLLSP